MNKTIVTGVAGLLVGVVLSAVIASWAVNGRHESTLKAFGIDTAKVVDPDKNKNDMDASMNNMTASLRGKTGDDFDKTFIREMITHHQGAIDMAHAAKTNAKHDEIKRMAEDIVSAQTKEISQMKQWQSEWNYAQSPSNAGHSMH